MSDHEITGFSIKRLSLPRNRVIGDSQVRSDMNSFGIVQLETRGGHVGSGFFGSSFRPLPALSELERCFAQDVMPGLAGRNVFTFQHRVSRPRGGNNVSAPYGFGQAVEQALWDLAGLYLDLPLYRLLGGTDPEVPAYASDLGFHLSDEDFSSLVSQIRDLGFTRLKIKVGHPDIEWDLRRLQLAHDSGAAGMQIMVDANEAWSGKEAIMRLHAYKDHGFDIFWVEDPCARDDYEGLRAVREAVPFCLVNSGEYLDLHGKRRLMDENAVDVLNCHGQIGATMRAGWLANDRSLRVSIGNTALELGVHLAAALPGRPYLEYSFHNTSALVEHPVQFENGIARAPDRPGHGVKITQDAIARWSSPDPAHDPSPETPGPIGPITLPRVRAA